MRYREDDPLIHLYPQETWHANAAVVGSRCGLEELREAIDRVLRGDKEYAEYGMDAVSFIAVPNDGERHKMAVHLLPYDHPNWPNLAQPYADNLDDRNDGDFILPPSQGWGLTRRSDLLMGEEMS